MNLSDKKCPCGNKLNYDSCCGMIHQDIKLAKTAEQLMRSRYSAFTIANGEYLQLSHHSKTRPNKRELKDLIKWTKSVQWVKLEVIKTEQGQENDKEGTVEFSAYFFSNGKLDVIHEKSIFLRDSTSWVYFKAR